MPLSSRESLLYVFNIQYVYETHYRVKTDQNEGNVEQQIGFEYSKVSVTNVTWDGFTQEIGSNASDELGISDGSYSGVCQQKYEKNGIVAKDS